MTERLSSGTERLDTILGGGLLRNAITLVIGVPGSGKTILAEQCVFANVDEDFTAIYFSTVSEPLDKMLRLGRLCRSSSQQRYVIASSTMTSVVCLATAD